MGATTLTAVGAMLVGTVFTAAEAGSTVRLDAARVRAAAVEARVEVSDMVLPFLLVLVGYEERPARC